MRLLKPNGISATDPMSMTSFGFISAGMKVQKVNQILSPLKQTMRTGVITWLVWLDHPVAFRIVPVRSIVLCVYSSPVITIVN